MVLERQQNPNDGFRFFDCASFCAAITSRTPGESVAHGFSQNTCLFAFTAAVRCCGRNPGGVASSTTSLVVMTFSYASNPTYARSIFTWLPIVWLPLSL